MMLFQRKTFFAPPQFANVQANGTSSNILGTVQKTTLDRTWPLEEILIHVDVSTDGVTGPTPRTGTTGQLGLDNVLNLVKNINLTINDGKQPRSIVDFSGIGLLEYASHVGVNLDAATWEYIRLAIASATPIFPVSQVVRYTIRVPLVHPMMAEPLRTRCLLPVHTYQQDPVLSLTLESATNMYSAGFLKGVQISYDLIRREMTDAQTKAIIDSGGFVNFDLIEQNFNPGTGVQGEQRIPISTPGSYLNMLLRSYLGGATATRDVLDQTTTFGQESRWRLETGGVVLRDWRWKQLQAINGYSQIQNGIQALSAPQISGVAAAGTSFLPAASVLLEFGSDGVDSFAELGSVLDCNTPAKSGLKMEIIGPIASAATNSSQLFYGGHRLYGDLAKWQAFK